MNESVVKKMNEIMDKDISAKNDVLSENDIIRLEQTYEIRIPFEYKEFLKEYGGCYVKDDFMYMLKEASPVTPEDGFDSIGYFYGSRNENIFDVIKANINTLGKELLPIADADGGDLICMGTEGVYKGKIYYWYHEGAFENEEDKRGKIYLIAESFDEFILNFRRHERDLNIDLDDIEITLDDDLLDD